MPRIVKDPEERRAEIVSAAEDLFLTRGYEDTSVNSIVEQVGIAKGLFYYYFKAKDEVLNAVADKYVQYIARVVGSIAEDSEQSAVEKVHEIMETVVNQFGLQSKGIRRLGWLFTQEKHGAIHGRLATRTVEEVTPHIVSILQQGSQEGSFDVDNPEFVAEVLMMWAVSAHNTVKVPITNRSQAMLKARAAENMIERILGAEPDSLDLLKYFQAIVDELSSFP